MNECDECPVCEKCGAPITTNDQRKFEPLRLEFPDGKTEILYMAGQVDPEIDRLTAERDRLRGACQYVLEDEPSGIPRASYSCRVFVRAALKEQP